MSSELPTIFPSFWVLEAGSCYQDLLLCHCRLLLLTSLPWLLVWLMAVSLMFQGWWTDKLLSPASASWSASLVSPTVLTTSITTWSRRRNHGKYAGVSQQPLDEATYPLLDWLASPGICVPCHLYNCTLIHTPAVHTCCVHSKCSPHTLPPEQEEIFNLSIFFA